MTVFLHHKKICHVCCIFLIMKLAIRSSRDVVSLLITHFNKTSIMLPNPLHSRPPKTSMLLKAVVMSHSSINLALWTAGSLASPRSGALVLTSLRQPGHQKQAGVHDKGAKIQEGVKGALTESVLISIFSWDCPGIGALNFTVSASRPFPQHKIAPRPTSFTWSHLASNNLSASRFLAPLRETISS